MKRASDITLLVLIFSALAVPGLAQATTAGVTSTSKIDKDAMNALNKMGAYLRTLTAFQVRAATTTEDVLDDGQKIQFEAVTDMLAQKPNHLRMEVTSDRQHRTYFFDGKQFTLWAQLVNYYATVPAPPTIPELADRLDTKYGIDLPLTDLFYWGTDRTDVRTIKSAMDVGPSQVEGTTCEQYAFRQDGLDWQIWIQNGDFPLPRKLVLTTMSDEARPQHTSVYTWNLAPSFNDAAFTFDPPTDSQKIVFAETGSSSR